MPLLYRFTGNFLVLSCLQYLHKQHENPLPFLKTVSRFLICLHISECQLSLELITDQLQVRLFIIIIGNIKFSVPTKARNCTV